MKTIASFLLVAAVAIAAAMLAGENDAADDKKPKIDVEKLMQAAHKGDKSPLSRIRAEVKKESPDWTQIAKDTQPLEKLGAAIKDNVSYTSMPGPYIKSVKTLKAATKKQDASQARLAVSGLMKSCAGCHRK